MKNLIKNETSLKYKQLLIENSALRARLANAEETLEAIRNGEVDALVVKSKEGDKIYTLEGSDYLYRILVETMHEGAVTATSDRLIIYCNNQFARIADVPIEKLTGELLDKLLHKEDISAFKELINKGLTKQSRGEVRIITGKGTTVPVLVSCNPINIGVPGVSLMITELTELKQIQEELQKTNEKLEDQVLERTKELSETNRSLMSEVEDHRKTEKALRESKATLQSFYDTSSYMMGVVEMIDSDVIIVHCNSAFAGFHGLSPEKASGKSCREFSTEEEHLIWMESYKISRNECKPVKFEYKKSIHEKDMWLYATVSYLGKSISNHDFFSFVIEDITERKLVQEKLKSSEENLQNIIKYAPAGIYEIDYITQRFRTVNDAMCRILGYEKEELLRLNPLDILDEDGRQLFKSRIEKVIEGENIDEVVEYKVRRKDGSLVWGMLNIELLYRNNKIDGALVVAYDITERKNIEEQLRKKNEQLIKINEVLEDFVYITAHDLRSPIANMKMLNEYISIAKGPEKKISLLNNLSPFIKSLERTIDGMVETIHVQKTDTNLSKKIYFKDIFDIVCFELKEDIAKYDVEIKPRFAAESIIYVDTYLISIFSNFLSNALKYSEKKKKSIVEFSTKQEGDYTLLTIKDNGIGINLEEEGKHMFKPFKRFSSQAEGTGMGLYIVKNIIEKNGGFIDVESAPGEGTTFYCYLKGYEM